MIKATELGTGKVYKFSNIRQAAGFFSHANVKASNFNSALVNIKAVFKGSQSTGATKSGTESRKSAFGCVWDFGAEKADF